MAADRGLYVTWEIEPGFAFNKPSDVQRILDAIPDDNFGVMYDTCHGQMVAVVGARQHGKKEILPGGQLEFIERLSGRINHIHLIDSDNTCHKDAAGNDETSTHAPFGDGVVDFDAILPRLAEGEAAARLVDHRSVLLGERLGGHRALQAVAGRAEPQVRLSASWARGHGRLEEKARGAARSGEVVSRSFCASRALRERRGAGPPAAGVR